MHARNIPVILSNTSFVYINQRECVLLVCHCSDIYCQSQILCSRTLCSKRARLCCYTVLTNQVGMLIAIAADGAEKVSCASLNTCVWLWTRLQWYWLTLKIVLGLVGGSVYMPVGAVTSRSPPGLLSTARSVSRSMVGFSAESSRSIATLPNATILYQWHWSGGETT